MVYEITEQQRVCLLRKYYVVSRGRSLDRLGSVSFLLGLFFLFVRCPIVGIILEIYGCLGLFRGFWPSVSVFLCHIPVVGWIIQYLVSVR
ncbi:hypothetical protein V6N13_060530 [Hibiscus sabdariffa]|uniref:Uncharacterized protein n=1 Tax=Hibiscus sabdariffa TaxID=183260 RepID=A0ABR2P7J3_9ROSI